MYTYFSYIKYKYINIYKIYIFPEEILHNLHPMPELKKRKIVFVKLTNAREKFLFFLILTLLMGVYTSPK